MSTPFSSIDSQPLSTTAANKNNTTVPAIPFLGNWLLKMATFGYAGRGSMSPATESPVIDAAVLPEVLGAVQEVLAGGEHVITTADAPGGSSSSNTGYSYGMDESMRGFSYISAYMTSSWAFLCIFMAILLNRTLVYAALRRPRRLSFRLRLILRITPAIFFVIHIYSILKSLRCQTSPHLPVLIFPQAAQIPYMPSDTGGFLYYLSRILTPWYPSSSSDVLVCQQAGMLPLSPFDTTTELRGSLTLLWPLYRTIALSLFFSTFSHALSGPVSPTGIPLAPSISSDTGLTFFEDSLAFAEAEALADPKTGNVAPEVLYIALISSFAHLTANIIGVVAAPTPRSRSAGGGARYRLITTGIWGVAFLGGFAWSLWRGVVEGKDGSEGRPGVLGFPKVCVVGFLPHLVILTGIVMCGGIYLLAALFSALAPSQSVDSNIRRRQTHPRRLFLNGPLDREPSSSGANTPENASSGLLDFSNLQATVTLSTLTLSLHEDFYTALLKTGFLLLTAASDATFLQEGEPINTPMLSWLEKERVRILARQKEWERRKKGPEAWGMEQLKNGSRVNGYTNEKKNVAGWMVGLPETQPKRAGKDGGRPVVRGGGRLVGALEFLRGVMGMVGGWIVKGLQKVRALGRGRGRTEQTDGTIVRRSTTSPPPGFNGGRERHLHEYRWLGEEDKLYFAFLRGTLTEDEDDDSEDYEPSEDDDDASSVIPTASSHFSRTSENSIVSRYDEGEDTEVDDYEGEDTEVDDDEGEDTEVDDDDGSCTPTQRRSLSPARDPEYLLGCFAHLLDPRTPEQKRMAKILSRHLLAGANERVTRSSSRTFDQQRNIDYSNNQSAGFDGLGASFEEDAEDLADLLLERRRADAVGGVGECVVCQSAPRTVIIWPCRCLSLCEECRMALAVRGFARCVCCRGEVGGFSRVFVP